MSYTNDTKPNLSRNYLLKEDAFYLLLETGDKILLQNSVWYDNDNKNINSYTNDAKGSGSYVNDAK